MVDRAFPESRRVRVEFRLRLVQVGHAQLEFEVHDRHNTRPLSLRFQADWLVLDLLKLDHPAEDRAAGIGWRCASTASARPLTWRWTVSG